MDGATLESRADEFGVTVSDGEVDAEVARRHAPRADPGRLVLVAALPEDAEADAEPTEEQLGRGRGRGPGGARADRGRRGLRDGGHGGQRRLHGLHRRALGWFEDGDVAYDAYFDALADAEAGDLVGPIETDRGCGLLELQDRREATTEGGLDALLSGQGVSDEAYRDYVREQMLNEAFASTSPTRSSSRRPPSSASARS